MKKAEKISFSLDVVFGYLTCFDQKNGVELNSIPVLSSDTVAL